MFSTAINMESGLASLVLAPEFTSRTDSEGDACQMAFGFFLGARYSGENPSLCEGWLDRSFRLTPWSMDTHSAAN
jgi:hypothetical protein